MPIPGLQERLFKRICAIAVRNLPGSVFPRVWLGKTKVGKQRRMKMSVIHIQFSIGEGGLHFCVIGNKAYIYDCGYYGAYVTKHEIYSTYFKIIKSLLQKKNIKQLNIYISHMHDDHCNLLKECLASIKPVMQKIIIWIPKINTPEKIHLLLTSKLNSAAYSRFFNFISDPKRFLDANDDSLLLREISPPEEKKYEPENEVNGFYSKIAGIEESTSDWVIDPLVIKETISPKLVQYIKDKFKGDLQKLKNEENFKNFQKEYKKEMKTLKEDYHDSMLCLYAGPTTPIYTNHLLRHHSYFPFRNRILSGWMHTGDAILKKLHKSDFYDYYKQYADCIGFMQIPHHGSKNNHDKNFVTDMFEEWIDYRGRIFYFTHSACGGRAKPKINDITQFIQIWPVSEFCNSCIVAQIV